MTSILAILASQVLSVKPVEQVHVKEFIPSMHEPPL